MCQAVPALPGAMQVGPEAVTAACPAPDPTESVSFLNSAIKLCVFTSILAMLFFLSIGG